MHTPCQAKVDKVFVALLKVKATKTLVISCREGLLYTFNSQCPEDRWLAEKEKLTVAAESFALLQ